MELGYLAATNDAKENITLTHNDLLSALTPMQLNPKPHNRSPE